MNTTEIGNDFEERSLGIIYNLLESEQLGYLSTHLKIKTKAPYYSQQRKKNIIFDLSIEVWPPGAKRYVMIYLIECKDYSRRVSVDKINDFIYRAQEIAPVNGKAIFITNSPLQEAAYNVAEATGMMVIQGESAQDYKIILHRSNRQADTDTIPFLKDTVNSDLIDVGVKLLEKLIDKQIFAALYENPDDTRIGYGIDRLSKEDIEQIASEELNHMNPHILSQAYHISPKSLAEYLKTAYDIEIVSNASPLNQLGFCDFNANTIGISQELINTPRELFVMAHELGHYILHQKLSIGQKTYEHFDDSEYNFSTGKHELNNPRQWIEWQANYFASCFVLPKGPLYYRLAILLENSGKARGKIYVDDQYQNTMDFNNIISKLAHRFSVSKTTVIYKLNELNLIDDRSRMKSIGSLIAEFREGLFA